MSEVTLKDMMEAGVHFGHQTRRWNPKMRKYIFGARNGIYIIDLQKTMRLFNKAIACAKQIGANGGTLLFIATKPQAREIVVAEAERSNMPYVTERWLGGMMTNFETIRKSVGRLKELDLMEEDGTFDALAKKEVVKLQKERGKLQHNLGGIRNMERRPDAVFIIDTKKEHIALNEAIKLHIPVIAIVDTNCDPEGIDYVIPGNDDAVRSISLIAHAVADALLSGKTEYEMKQRAISEERERAAAAKKAEDQARKEAMAAARAQVAKEKEEKEKAAAEAKAAQAASDKPAE